MGAELIALCFVGIGAGIGCIIAANMVHKRDKRIEELVANLENEIDTCARLEAHKKELVTALCQSKEENVRLKNRPLESEIRTLRHQIEEVKKLREWIDRIVDSPTFAHDDFKDFDVKSERGVTVSDPHNSMNVKRHHYGRDD